MRCLVWVSALLKQRVPKGVDCLAGMTPSQPRLVAQSAI